MHLNYVPGSKILTWSEAATASAWGGALFKLHCLYALPLTEKKAKLSATVLLELKMMMDHSAQNYETTLYKLHRKMA